MFGQNENPFANPAFDPENLPQGPQSEPAGLRQAPVAAPDPLDSLFPEIYYDLYPSVADAANKMIGAGYTPGGEALDRIVDNIIRNSGMWYEDEDDDFDRPDAMPVVLAGRNRPPYRRRRRRHHNRNTLRDVIRILLLQEVGRGRGGHPYPFF